MRTLIPIETLYLHGWITNQALCRDSQDYPWK
jgi:hypothetical protein